MVSERSGDPAFMAGRIPPSPQRKQKKNDFDRSFFVCVVVTFYILKFLRAGNLKLYR
jgi:hypothetical protein